MRKFMKRAWVEAAQLGGDTLFLAWRAIGKLSSRMLMEAQWRFDGGAEWFDHRHHLLDPERCFKDYWSMSGDNVISVLPIGGRVLDLCSGDGFYARWYYGLRAREVVCVERNKGALRTARRWNNAPNLCFLEGDVLQFEPEPAAFDVVVCRGAIEHFREPDQQTIFAVASRALKPGGWFCGDTPLARPDGKSQLHAHEHEWKDEAEARHALGSVFSRIHTEVLASADRTTLFWRAAV